MTEKDKKLFELQRKVEELEERIAIMTEGKDVVPCKDCKHGENCNLNIGDLYYCEENIGTFGSAVHEADWFCADGERKPQK